MHPSREKLSETESSFMGSVAEVRSGARWLNPYVVGQRVYLTL